MDVHLTDREVEIILRALGVYRSQYQGVDPEMDGDNWKGWEAVCRKFKRPEEA